MRIRTVVALFLTLPLFADPVVFHTASADAEAGVIIEFHEPPLLARTQTREAMRSMDSLHERLERDLATLDPRVAANAESRALRFRYRVAFAGASARVSRTSIAAIRALPYVKAVHLDQKMEAHVTNSVPRIGAPKVWEELNVRGRGIVVAVLDTGIDYRHRALGKGFGPGFKVAGGYDFYNNDDDPKDDNGHGTHVAGIIAGNEAPVIGVAPDATLLAYKVLGEEGQGEMSTIIAAVDRTVDPNGDGDPSDHVDIVNMSLGGPRVHDDPLVQAVERATAAGVVFAISAGNSKTAGSIRSPGLAPSAITVGSTDQNDHTSIFSSRGPIGGDWTLKPEVAAPGELIESAKRGGGTLGASGTSMAAPHVAGVAALLLERHPDWTPADVKAAIVSTAIPAAEADTTPSILGTGAGRVEARRALDATMLPSPTAISFGIVTKHGEAWTSTRSLRFTNRGKDAETLTFRVPPLPRGAKLTIAPSELTIAPNTVSEVTLTLTFDKNTPEPTENNTSFAGRIEVAGTKSSLVVPWAAVNGDVLSVTYNGSDDFNIAVFASMNMAPLWVEGPRSFGTFAVYAADIVVLDAKYDGEPRLIVRELQPVRGTTRVTLSPDEAKLRVLLDGQDIRGVPFAELAKDDKNKSVVTQHYVFPTGGRVHILHGDGKRALRISPLAKTDLRTYEVLLTPDDAYTSMRQTWSIQEDTSLGARASDWASQAIHHRCQTDCAVTLASGIGHIGSLGFTWYPLKRGERTWTLHMTELSREDLQTDDRDFRAHVVVAETTLQSDEDLANRWTYITGAFRNRGGRIAVSPSNRSTAGDYFPRSAQHPVILSEGPVALWLAMGKDRYFEAQPNGALGMLYGDNALHVTAKRFDMQGNEVALTPISNPGRWMSQRDVPQGPYRLELTDTYRVAGRPGRLGVTALYDSRTPGMPSLMMLHVEDANGLITSTVPKQTPARLSFAAREWTYMATGNFYPRIAPIDASATRVWWRRSGTTEWQPLAITMTGSDHEYNSELAGSVGTMYVADLRNATLEEGAIDLKIALKGDNGATTENVYEPAFIVTPPADGRRRAAGK